MIGETKRILGGLGVLLLFHTAAWTQIISSAAPLVGDAFINPGVATNFGATVNVNVGGPAGSQGLLRFDLSTMTGSPANIAVAALRLYVNKVGTAGSVDVYEAVGAWSEATVNGSAGYPLPGALLASAVPVSVAGSYIVIPVTSQVQSWIGSGNNNGFLILPHAAGTSVFFDSKENQNTIHPAVLEIDIFGQTGTRGPSGPSGPTGVKGATGPTGATGPAGPTGASGTLGATGLAGAQGPIGPSGPAGPNGAVGPTGPTGPVGATGATGASGPRGPQGVAGPTGPTGGFGPQGASGPTGAAGLAGPAGANGPRGLINNNFTVLTGQTGNFTISDAETHNQIIVVNALNNGSVTSNTVTLPHATTVGAGFTIGISAANWGIHDGTLLIQVQGGDQIISQAVTSSSVNLAYQGEFVSDGLHTWYLLLKN